MLHHEKKHATPNRREVRERQRLEALRLALSMYPGLLRPETRFPRERLLTR